MDLGFHSSLSTPALSTETMRSRLGSDTRACVSSTSMDSGLRKLTCTQSGFQHGGTDQGLLQPEADTQHHHGSGRQRRSGSAGHRSAGTFELPIRFVTCGSKAYFCSAPQTLTFVPSPSGEGELEDDATDAERFVEQSFGYRLGSTVQSWMF